MAAVGMTLRLVCGKCELPLKMLTSVLCIVMVMAIAYSAAGGDVWHEPVIRMQKGQLHQLRGKSAGR